MEKFENNKIPVDPKDTALIKTLTVTTQFCDFCYKPFNAYDEDNMRKKELIGPFKALLELTSIFLFIIFAWFPLLFLLGILALWEKLCGRSVRIS